MNWIGLQIIELFCIWGGTTPCISTFLELKGLKSSSTKNGRGVLLDAKLTMNLQCALQAKKANRALTPQVEGGDPSPLLSTGETHLESWACSQLPSTRETWMYWSNSDRGAWIWYGDCSIFRTRRDWESCACSACKESVTVCINMWWENIRRGKQTLFSSSYWLNKRRWAQTKTYWIPMELNSLLLWR